MQYPRSALLKGGAVAGAFFVIVGVVTGFLPTPIFDRMVPRSGLDFVFLALTSVLAGAYAAQRAVLADQPGDACAYAGGGAGFLAVACPHCNVLLVALFSGSWLATYVDPIRPLFGLLAVALLAGIVYRRHARTVVG
ncbi:hypothetical protein JCM17823_16380 [Halorubrum gandharaense]